MTKQILRDALYMRMQNDSYTLIIPMHYMREQNEKRGDTMVYLAFIDMMIATFLVYAVWSTIDEARGCFDEYNLYYRNKLRNNVMTLDFYLRMFIVGLIPIINILMIYLYTYEKAERLEEWIDIIQSQFTLESR